MLQGMLWDTSLLDPEEGIRFRGFSIPELQVSCLPAAFPAKQRRWHRSFQCVCLALPNHIQANLLRAAPTSLQTLSLELVHSGLPDLNGLLQRVASVPCPCCAAGQAASCQA